MSNSVFFLGGWGVGDDVETKVYIL